MSMCEHSYCQTWSFELGPTVHRYIHKPASRGHDHRFYKMGYQLGVSKKIRIYSDTLKLQLRYRNQVSSINSTYSALGGNSELVMTKVKKAVELLLTPSLLRFERINLSADFGLRLSYILYSDYEGYSRSFVLGNGIHKYCDLSDCQSWKDRSFTMAGHLSLSWEIGKGFGMSFF